MKRSDSGLEPLFDDRSKRTGGLVSRSGNEYNFMFKGTLRKAKSVLLLNDDRRHLNKLNRTASIF